MKRDVAPGGHDGVETKYALRFRYILFGQKVDVQVILGELALWRVPKYFDLLNVNNIISFLEIRYITISYTLVSEYEP